VGQLSAKLRDRGYRLTLQREIILDVLESISGHIAVDDVYSRVHPRFPQVNMSTIRTVMDKLGQPMEHAHTIMHRVGYTGSACIPMALDDAVRTERIRDGDLVVMTGSGAGLSMGTVALHWRTRS